MFTELVHVVPTLNDFLGSPVCEKGSDYMGRANGKRNFREERSTVGNFTGYVSFKGRKGQINVAA